MLLLFLCLLFCGISNGEYSSRCGNREGFSFVEATDIVDGRYRLEWCTQVDQTMDQYSQWEVSMRYNVDPYRENCSQYETEYSEWKLHSIIKEQVTINLNCTNVCLSTNIDLIFNGTCYGFKTYLSTKRIAGEVHRHGEKQYLHYVYNSYTKDTFAKSQAAVSIYASGEHVVADWSLHLVPATDYTMDLCPLTGQEVTEECTNVTDNCTTTVPSRTRLRCELWPPPQSYRLVLRHRAPWTNGVDLFGNISSVEIKSAYVQPAEVPVVTQPASAAPWWALGGALALVLGGGAAALACRSHLVGKLRNRVKSDWQARAQAETAARRGEGGGTVLLLYARDCAPMMAVAAQLRALLLRSADRVYDLYGADTVRLAARAPADWVRRVLARDDVRVVLLQSPAAACLHAPALLQRGAPPDFTLERPLLARRVAYRAPHSSDCLLPLALRLLADTAHTTHSYKKFYVATITGLEAELVREVTPLRRYPLPAAAELLLRDLCDGAWSPDPELEGGLRRFSEAVRELHDHVRANPSYLDEELIFFDYD